LSILKINYTLYGTHNTTPSSLA